MEKTVNEMDLTQAQAAEEHLRAEGFSEEDIRWLMDEGWTNPEHHGWLLKSTRHEIARYMELCNR